MYQETAYNTENLIEQSEGEALGYWTKKLNSGSKLKHRKANSDIPTNSFKRDLPSDEAFKLREESLKSEGDAKEMFWTEEVLSQFSFSPFTHVFLIFVGLAKIFTWMFFPLYTIFFIIAFFNAPEIERSVAISEMLPLYLYFILPCKIIYIYHELSCKDGFEWLTLPIYNIGELYSLNRKTGMVTLYKNGGKIRFSHPFLEFDCYSISSPTAQGHRNSSLVLVHRYNNYKRGIPLHLLLGAGQNVLEYSLLWNMIQRYMDVSQPLPDCIILEESRERDPVTAAHDKKTGRNPGYWRDMTDEEYLIALDKLDKAQQENTESAPLIDIIKGEVLDTPMVVVSHKSEKHPKNRYKHRKRK